MEDKLNALRQANKYQALRLLYEANLNAPACFQRQRKKFVEVQQEIEKRFVRKPLPTFKVIIQFLLKLYQMENMRSMPLY